MISIPSIPGDALDFENRSTLQLDSSGTSGPGVDYFLYIDGVKIQFNTASQLLTYTEV